MPRSYLFQLPTKGHISRDCTNQRAERAPPSTGSNAVAVANRAPAGSMRIQSVTLSQAYAASKTTRNAGGTTQQRRQERAGHPAGLSSQKRQTRGEEDSAEVSADMDWNELEPESAAITIEPISKGSGTTSAQSAEVPPVIISAEGAAQKPKHIRPVEPDRVQWKVTVAAGGMTFNNVIFDRGNDKTRMGTHVAQALGIEPAITNRSIMMADGRTKPLKGKSGHIDFYVKGIGGRKGMGLCI
ncbi:hypothetical protein BGZ97_008091, partial [Linnemannia gamsii]